MSVVRLTFMERHRRFINGRRYMRVSGYWDPEPHYVVGNKRPENGEIQ